MKYTIRIMNAGELLAAGIIEGKLLPGQAFKIEQSINRDCTLRAHISDDRGIGQYAGQRGKGVRQPCPRRRGDAENRQAGCGTRRSDEVNATAEIDDDVFGYDGNTDFKQCISGFGRNAVENIVQIAEQCQTIDPKDRERIEWYINELVRWCRGLNGEMQRAKLELAARDPMPARPVDEDEEEHWDQERFEGIA